jgi:hypothetical protein
MALSPEMQAVVDQQKAIEDIRHNNQAVVEGKRIKMEVLRLAKEVLVENRRTKSLSEATDITSANVKDFADVLTDYVNS